MSRGHAQGNLKSLANPTISRPSRIRGEFEEIDNGYLLTIYADDCAAPLRVFIADAAKISEAIIAESARRRLG